MLVWCLVMLIVVGDDLLKNMGRLVGLIWLNVWWML